MLQERLLEIAADAFARDGLDGASTRAIAAAAGTAMSSITYHYGGKQGLYLAAADYIAKNMGRHMATAFSDDDVPDAGDPASARAALKRLLACFVDEMVGNDSTTWSLFIVREQMEPTAAFDRIYDGLMGRMQQRLVDLLACATGIGGGDRARIAVITLLGQVIVLRASRASIVRLLRRDAIDADAAAAIKARVAANTDAILDMMIREREEGR